MYLLESMLKKQQMLSSESLKNKSFLEVASQSLDLTELNKKVELFKSLALVKACYIEFVLSELFSFKYECNLNNLYFFSNNMLVHKTL